MAVRTGALVVAFVLWAILPAAGEPLALSVRLIWEDAPTVIVTDRGNRVRLAEAALSSLGFAVVPCAEQSARPALIRAGHFSGALPNQVALVRVESALGGAPVEIAGFDPPDLIYCEAHYVVGPGPEGFAFRLAGSYQVPGDDTWRPFRAVTPQGFGAFVAIERSDGHTFRGRLPASGTLTVRRAIARAFDGIDLATVGGVALAYAVLRRIVSGAEIRLIP